VPRLTAAVVAQLLTEENGSGCAERSTSSASGDLSTWAAASAAGPASDPGAGLSSTNPSSRACCNSRVPSCIG
jgi:hypothetical protein